MTDEFTPVQKNRMNAALTEPGNRERLNRHPLFELPLGSAAKASTFLMDGSDIADEVLHRATAHAIRQQQDGKPVAARLTLRYAEETAHMLITDSQEATT